MELKLQNILVYILTSLLSAELIVAYDESIVFAKVVSCAKCKLRENPEVRAFIFEDLEK